jgi:hypothetical protein
VRVCPTDRLFRLLAEKAEESSPVKKRRRTSQGVHGVEAKNMSLVTLNNVKNRPVGLILFKMEYFLTDVVGMEAHRADSSGSASSHETPASN